MRVIYFLTEVILLISFILIKKSENKRNILEEIFFNIVILFCYNTLVCYILTFFAILSKLWILSIINIIFSALMLIKIIRRKEIQKFIFEKTDFIFIIISLVIIIGISYLNFEFPFNVNYETSDPSVHYLTAVEFAEEEILLPGTKEVDYIYGRLSARKTVSYVNSGLLMKTFSNNLDPIQCYNIFVAFGILTLFLTGIIVFYTLKRYVTKKIHIAWAMIISLICILGYPLNSFLFGFEYLSMGILIVCAIINLIYFNDKELGNKKVILISLFLLNFGLFSSYYMFVPIVYPAEWIYFCIRNYKDNKKIITKELIILLTTVLLIPFILGYIYHLAPDIYAIIINKSIDIENIGEYSKYQVNDGFKVNGYIYINKYSNFILLIPLTIYYFIKEKKENRTFDLLLLICIIIFLTILYVGYFNEKVSIYYLSKNYFVLWIFLLYCNYKALIKLDEKTCYIPNLLIFMYIILIILELCFSRVKLNGNELENKYENVFEVTQIFAANKNIIEKQDIELKRDEIKILEYAMDNLNFNSHIEVASDPKQYLWSYVILRHIREDEEIKYTGQTGIYNKVICNLEKDVEKADYIIYFNRSSYFQYLKDKIFEESEIIYQNESGGIVKHKK